MDFKIKNILLYAVDDKHKPRSIPFAENLVNVITGYSQRGKSAIISIIDYCLGSSDCNIPIGRIRDKVDKFALYVEIKGEKIFLARDCPSSIGHPSDTMYYYNVNEKGENKELNSNAWIKNAAQYKVNRAFVKSFLSRLAGFENVTITENSKEVHQLSFRDTAAFQFQPQSIIANPTTIFYKTDTWEHLSRLRTLFPLVLGYKSYEILNLEKDLDETLDKLKDKQKKLEDLKRQYESWQGELYEIYMVAVRLNVTTANMDIDISDVESIKKELINVAQRIQNNTFLKEGSTLVFTEKLDQLELERDVLQQDLNDFRVELSKIQSFDRSKELYVADVAEEVERRLKPIDYFLNLSGTNACPFCDSVSDKAVNSLLELKHLQERNKSVITEAKTLDFSFEKEKNNYQRLIRQKEQAILKIDNSIRVLISENNQEARRVSRILAFSGEISTVLDGLKKIEPSAELPQEIQMLESEITTKTQRLKSLRAKFNRDDCIDKVKAAIDVYIKVLPIEEKNNKHVLLDPEKSASIKVQDVRTNNINFLSKLGSGANHMCYHLATMLGLHEYFLNLPSGQKINYIPSFLVLDQPSQVYFPENFGELNETTNATKKQRISKDMTDTRAIFEACNLFIERTKGKCQVIVLEHANEDTWTGLSNIHKVESWRGESESDREYKALIPKNWL